MSIPRLVDRPLKERLLIMLPIIATGIAGFVLVPLTMHIVGLPLQLAETWGPIFVAILGSKFALNTRPDGTRHLFLLSLSVFAMVAVSHLVYVLIHLAIAPGGGAAGAAWLGLTVLSIAAGIGAVAGTWYLIARLTRGENLWGKPGGAGAEGNPA